MAEKTNTCQKVTPAQAASFPTTVLSSRGAVINNADQDLPLAESAAETEIGSRIQPPSGRQAAGRQATDAF